jgi:hypothetical protein
LPSLYFAKEEFNGADAVVSYLISEGENHESYNDRPSHRIRSPEHVGARTRWNALWKPRHAPFRKPCRNGTYRERTQKYFGKYAWSHRARSKRINTDWVSYEPDRRIRKSPARKGCPGFFLENVEWQTSRSSCPGLSPVEGTARRLVEKETRTRVPERCIRLARPRGGKNFDLGPLFSFVLLLDLFLALHGREEPI